MITPVVGQQAQELASDVLAKGVEASFLAGYVERAAEDAAKQINAAGVAAQIQYLLMVWPDGDVKTLLDRMLKDRSVFIEPFGELEKDQTATYYKQRHERLRAMDSRSWHLMNDGDATSEEHRKLVQKIEAANKEMMDYLLTHPDLKHCVLNMSVMFQSNRGLKDEFDNYALSELLVKQFPQGADDTESGQGWFYIHEDFLPEVMKWLKDGNYAEEAWSDATLSPMFKWPAA